MSAAADGGTFRSLRVRNYKLFFIGQLVSVAGTWMQAIAQVTFVLFRLKGGGRQLGILSACTFLPVLCFGLWCGAIVDRGNKRMIVLGAQTVMAVTATAQTLVVLTGHATFPILCAIASVFGMANAFDMPARQAFVSEMVGPDDLPNAVGLNSAVFNSGRIVGQALGGVLVSAIGYAWCFGINAFSFLAVIASLVMMRRSELRLITRAPRERGQIADGLRYVRDTPVLRTVIGLVLIIGTFSLNFQVFLPLLAKNVFHGKEPKVAFFQVVLGIGSLTGSLLGARRKGPSGRMLVRSSFFFGVGFFGMALSHSEPLTLVFIAVVGTAFITFMLTANATLQLSSEPAKRGRVMALYGLVFAGTTPIGSPTVGWIADHFGARTSIAVGGAAALGASALAAGALRRGLLVAGRSATAPVKEKTTAATRETRRGATTTRRSDQRR